MGTRIIKLPDVGEGVAEAEIVEWHVKVGESVLEDQLLAAVMTDKATVEIPSPVAGTVVALGGGGRQRPGGRRRAGPPGGRGRRQRGSGGRASRSDAAAGPPSRLSPRRPRRLNPRLPPAPAASVTRAPLGPPRPPGEKPIASPAVRRRAREAGVDLRQVRGTGPAGRIGHDRPRCLPARRAEGRNAGRPGRQHRGRDRQDHRPAPAHRPEDGRVEAPGRSFLLCRGGRRHRARGAARHPECREPPGSPAPDADAVPDAGAGQGGRRFSRDECALRRRGGDPRAARRRPYRHRHADAGGPHGARGPPLRGAQPVGLRRRGAAPGRGGARGQGDAAPSSPARPSPSPAWARSAASSPRR